jgi:hypothetical protein
MNRFSCAASPTSQFFAYRQHGLSKLWALIAIVAIAGLYLGYERYQVANVRLSERPDQTAVTQPMLPQESGVVASIFVSHASLRTMLNGIAAKLAGTKNGSEEVKCVSSNIPKFKECLTANWNVQYQAGSVDVAKAGDLLKVTLPVSFTGGAGFGGEIAKVLSVNNKTIDGAAVVSASLSVELDDRFCPVLTVKNTEFSWTKEASVQVIGKSKVFGVFQIGPERLNVSHHLNGPILAALKLAAEQASHAIPCEPVRADVEKFWKRYSVPITTQGQPTLYLNAWPEAVGSSGLLSEDNGIRIVLMMSGKALIETSPGNATPLGDLPVHQKILAQSGQLKLAVPIRVDYAKLREVLMGALSSRHFDKDTDAGKISVQLQDFEFFPSGERVAVGVQFQAEAPTGIFDTRGTVWILAKPQVSPDGKSLRLSDIAIHRKIDNEALKVLTAIFEGPINNAITEAAYYDLRKDEQAIIASLQSAISDPSKTSGVKLTITEPSIQFGRIAVEESALSAEGIFKAGWNAEVQEVKL